MRSWDSSIASPQAFQLDALEQSEAPVEPFESSEGGSSAMDYVKAKLQRVTAGEQQSRRRIQIIGGTVAGVVLLRAVMWVLVR